MIQSIQSGRWARCLAILFTAVTACFASCGDEIVTRCETTADCCSDSPSSLCTGGVCKPNPFCEADPNCRGARWGVCTGRWSEIPKATCGDRPSSEDGVSLDMKVVLQPCSQLCWAAVSTMIGRYFDRGVEQCELATVKTGGNCCAAASCLLDVCNQPALGSEITDVLARRLDLHGRWIARQLAPEELENELSNGRPVVVGFRGPFSGHVAVVAGFTPGAPTTYRVLDPWPEFGEMPAVTYQQLVAGPMMEWVETWFGLSPRFDGCNPDFDGWCGCGASSPKKTSTREGLSATQCEAAAYCPATGQTATCRATPYRDLTDSWSEPLRPCRWRARDGEGATCVGATPKCLEPACVQRVSCPGAAAPSADGIGNLFRHEVGKLAKGESNDSCAASAFCAASGQTVKCHATADAQGPCRSWQRDGFGVACEGRVGSVIGSRGTESQFCRSPADEGTPLDTRGPPDTPTDYVGPRRSGSSQATCEARAYCPFEGRFVTCRATSGGSRCYWEAQDGVGVDCFWTVGASTSTYDFTFCESPK
jgi:hypothetical protein